MKNIIFSVVIIILVAGCTPLERKNPTDPGASNYTGWHYTGEAGEFSSLADFAVKNGYVYCVDAGAEKIGVYGIDGSFSFFIENPATPAPKYFILPTGACADAVYLYVLDRDTSYELERMALADIHDGDNSIFVDSINIETGGDKIATDGSFLYVADSAPPGVYVYDSSNLTGNPVTAVSSWPVIQGSGAGELMYISDIEVHSSGNILIADSDLDRITVFNAGGGFIRKIDVNTGILGIAVKGDTIYVSNVNGIYKIDYNTGMVTGTMADFGEGNGRVTAPGLIEVYGDYVLAGTGTSIKYFGQ